MKNGHLVAPKSPCDFKMYACMYVCMYVCMDGWMDGWMDMCMYVYIKLIRHCIRQGSLQVPELFFPSLSSCIALSTQIIWSYLTWFILFYTIFPDTILFWSYILHLTYFLCFRHLTPC